MASFAMGIPVFSDTSSMACAALSPLECQNRAPSICIRICIRLPWFGSVMPLYLPVSSPAPERAIAGNAESAVHGGRDDLPLKLPMNRAVDVLPGHEGSEVQPCRDARPPWRSASAKRLLTPT